MKLRSGLVVNMGKSYVKLSTFNEEDDANEWLEHLYECIS